MEETVIFEKVKTNGSTIKKRVPVFRDGTWKDWLEWLLRLSEYYVFMGYQNTEEDQFAFVEDLQVLLFDDDLLMFNDVVVEEQLEHVDVAIHSLRRLTMVHCPPGTRTLIIDELTDLRKTARAFRKLNRYLTFIDENEAIPEADCVRMYKSGMPIEWQIEVSRLSRSWDFAGLEQQFELIERVENEAEALRNRRRPTRDNKSSNAAQSRESVGGHQQQQRRNGRPGRGGYEADRRVARKRHSKDSRGQVLLLLQAQ
ncbi:hypothetical protein PHMEG_00038773 [Phytophthora megakarya]|uniref:Uncharacterized protein n=1 Tax=Phytophthora megakarya TaxID=4795 RepID=A0A225UGZ4_9STRA|nr:hypothetical protein PHMEG_00038773 [Phytophthora megakarya]